ncbi:MAG: thiamine pyrophosphate-binding protein [Thermomicrobiales bacterium]
MSEITGGAIVARTLRDLGADVLFSVSGNQILPIYDAIIDTDLRLIHMRHESAAAYAAAAFAEMRDAPGVALVSAAPAFLAALPGVATCRQMELPLLFLNGAGRTAEVGAGGFQDFDYASAAQTVRKATVQVTNAAQIRQVLIQAWRLAQAYVPGPVHVSLPVDTLLAATHDEPGTGVKEEPVPPRLTAADEAALAAMAARLSQAARSVIVARPSAARGPAGVALRTLASRLGITPVVTEAPRGLGDLKYGEAIRRYAESDCALVIGPADFAVGFLDPSVIASRGEVLLIDAPGDPAPRRAPHIHLHLPPLLALAHLAAIVTSTARVSASKPVVAPSSDGAAESAMAMSAGIHPFQVAVALRTLLEPDDVIVLDGGEFAQWIRFGLRDLPNRVLWNSKLGGIGGSIPLAVGIAAAGHRGRTIVLVGDGAAGYHLSEFETAVRHGLPFIAIVGNDGRWAAEWHMQVSRYGAERAVATDLSPTRYDMVARGFGATSDDIHDLASFRAALAARLAEGRPACLNVHVLSIPSPAAQA